MHSTEIRLFASSVKVLQQGTTKWIGKNNSRGSSRAHRKPPIEYKPRDPDSTSTSAGPRLGPKRKVACLFGYNGTGYSGLQFNPDTDKTIESDLFKGLVASGLVSKENSTDLKKSALCGLLGLIREFMLQVTLYLLKQFYHKIRSQQSTV